MPRMGRACGLQPSEPEKNAVIELLVRSGSGMQPQIWIQPKLRHTGTPLVHAMQEAAATMTSRCGAHFSACAYYNVAALLTIVQQRAAPLPWAG